MAHQYSVALRTAQAGVIESTVGASPKLQLRTGAAPANCAAVATGTLLAELALPSDWLGAAAAGAVAMAGVWTGTGVADGSAGHFRILDNAGTTCHMQGTVTASGGGGDMTLNNVAIATGQDIEVLSFTVTRGNA
jgi:hypothetical protein